jgi:hypothetical protein
VQKGRKVNPMARELNVEFMLAVYMIDRVMLSPSPKV